MQNSISRNSSRSASGRRAHPAAPQPVLAGLGRGYWAFAAFVSFVMLLGGASRYDVLSLAPLRAVSALVAAIVIFRGFKGPGFVGWKTLAIFLAALAAIMTIQLIPLPYSVWTLLPGREAIAEADRLLGLGEIWRPITLSSAKTANSLAALIVPFAALLLLRGLNREEWAATPLIFVALATLSALIGLSQVLAPGGEALYFYRVTNNGDAVGLFANRNHNAVFIAAAIALALVILATSWKRRSVPMRASLVTCAVVMVAANGFNASRAGIVATVIAFVLGAAAWWQAREKSRAGTKASRYGKSAIVMSGAAVLVAGLAVLAINFSSRIPALQRFAEDDPLNDLRSSLLPLLGDMIGNNLPFGVGFGAFEYAYRMVEPDALLGPAYLNNAHTDWLQFIIEGGIPALVLMLVIVLAATRKLWRVLSDPLRTGMRRSVGLAGAAVLIIIALGCLVDYPARVPSVMVFAVWAMAALWRGDTTVQHHD